MLPLTLTGEMAYYIQGKRVSEDWYYVLTELAKRVNFQLNSGQRTMAEQWRLYNLYKAGIGNLAAYPNPTAPHIRDGRQDHALDIDMYAGVGTQGVIRELAKMGINTSLTVPGEGWHIEAQNATKLHQVAQSLKKPRTIIDRLREHPLGRGDKTPDVKSVQTWLKRGKYLPKDFKIAQKVGTFGPVLVEAVKKFQKHVGLPVDGIVGPKTAAALRRRYGWKVWNRKK